NDYIEHPEKYQKPRKKKEIDLDKQEQAIKNNMKDFHSDLAYERGSVNVKESEDAEQENKQDATSKDNTTKQVLDEHTKQVKQRSEERRVGKEGKSRRAQKDGR